MKKTILLIAVFAASLFTVSPLLSQPAYAQADASSQQACKTIKSINPNDTSCGAADGQVSKIIRIVLQMLSIVAGIIAVIMVIISGLKYITSQGDSNKIASAKNSLIYAIVGLVIVAAAQIIVQFVIRTSSNNYDPNIKEEESSAGRQVEGRQQRFESAVD